MMRSTVYHNADNAEYHSVISCYNISILQTTSDNA